MKTAGAVLDVATIRDLVRPLEPAASVYLRATTPDAALDSAEELAIRIRMVEERLRTQGADESTVEAVAAALARHPSPQAGVAVLATGGNVVLEHPLPDGTPTDRARFGAPADVIPLLSWLWRHPAYVLVVTDRTGADVTAVPAGAASGPTRAVVGPDDEIERNAPGGWSQPRYQRRAEDSWLHNAATVADAVTRALRDLHAGLLLVAGDVRAVQLLRDQLPSALRRDVSIRHIPGGRGNDGSAEIQHEAVAAAVAAYAVERTEAEVRRFTDAGPARAVTGVHDTLHALAEGRLDTLLISDDPDDDRIAWYTPTVRCADTPDQLPDAVPGRLPDVAVRAALLTDAMVRVVPAPLRDGIGGLCRFAP